MLRDLAKYLTDGRRSEICAERGQSSIGWGPSDHVRCISAIRSVMVSADDREVQIYVSPVVDEWMMIMPALLGTLGFLSATTLLLSCFII